MEMLPSTAIQSRTFDLYILSAAWKRQRDRRAANFAAVGFRASIGGWLAPAIFPSEAAQTSQQKPPAGMRPGITGTPAFWINCNGILVKGAPPQVEFEEIMDLGLAAMEQGTNDSSTRQPVSFREPISQFSDGLRRD